MTGAYPNFVIAPIMDPQHVGTFPISVILKDRNNATAKF